MKLSDVSIDRPVFTTMMAFAVLVLGGLGFARLGVELFPDISFPVVTVTTPYPGAGPEEIEEQVTRPLEEAVSSVSGIDQVRSVSRDNVSLLVVTFKLEADIRQAASDVRDRVSAIRGTLPAGVRDPTITRVDPSAIPVLIYAVSGPHGPLATRRLVDDVVRPALERVDGVGSVTAAGGEVREIQVDLGRARLEEQGLTIAQVAQAIGAEGEDVPGGHIVDGAREVGLKTVARFGTWAEVGEVVLAARPDGSLVRVRDLGEVVDGKKEQRTLTRVNGVPGVTFEVQKRGGANTIAVVDRVEAAARALEVRLPKGTRLVKVIDSSTFIRNNMHELERSLLLGAFFAVVVIFLFMLDWRSTLISAVALPTSVVATFLVMWVLGFTLNIMTMMGLSLAIGLLIDDSVVVRENIFRRMERGEDPVTAARKGTAEIALAVMATTFTIVAVFGPVAFTGGLIGKFFREFGITVSAAVIVSLLVSFPLDPMLSARVTRRLAADHHERLRRHPALGPVLRALEALDGGYRRVLAWTLDHRKTVVGGAALLFAGSLMLGPLMGQEFAGRGDQGNFTVSLELPAATALAETDRVTRQVEAILRREPEIVDVVATVGPGEEVNKATLAVRATPKAARRRSLAEIMETARPALAAVPGLTYAMREAGLAGGSGAQMEEAPVVIVIRGADYGALARWAGDAFAVVRGTAGVRDAAISYRPGRHEETLVVDRTRAGDRGVSAAAIAVTLRTAVEGHVAGRYREGEHESDIRVRLRAQDRRSLAALGALAVPARTGQTVYLRDVTHPVPASTPGAIDRLDRERQITISSNVVGRSLGEVVADLQARLDALPHPGITFALAGEAERMKETFGNLGLALALSIVFIYLVLASQFESFLHPLTIMLSLPLAVVGALALLFLADYPMGMAAMIGIILLMGLVTKNAILLVDRANQLRAEGRPIREALLEAGASRLRPILMTSAAMVLGMLPTAISKGEGSEFRAPMSTAVIGGVITSTLLTLVVVPVVYVWVDRLTLRGRRERRAARLEAAADQASRSRSAPL